jgi:hypothetical protein
MSINKLFLEPDGLVVGNNQLVASGGGVSVGKNLVVQGTVYTSNIQISNSTTGNSGIVFPDGSFQTKSAFDASGNIGIGTSTISTGNKLAIYGGNIQIGTAGSSLRFPDGTMQTTAAVGTSIAVTNDAVTNANTYYPSLTNNVTSGTLSALVTSSTKLYYNPSTGTFNANIFNSLSDINKKTDVKVISDSSAILDQIRGVRFNWRDNSQPSAGLIAQDVEAVMPELVNAAEDGTKSLNYNGIIGVLVETIKELRSEVKTLSAKVAVLEDNATKDVN